MVWAVCRRALPRPADAEDAFQATFLVLARRAGAVRNPAAVGCWLYGVAGRVARRMRARATPTAADAGADVPARPGADGPTVREFLQALDDELGKLSAKFRDPLVLCFLPEQTRDEAARRLGISPSTLKRRLAAGRDLLRARFARRGVDLSAVVAAAGVAGGTAGPAVAAGVVRAAVLGPAAGGVSAGVVTLTEGVVRAMWHTKLKAVAAGCVMLAAGAGGTGYLAVAGGDGPPVDGGRGAPAARAPADESSRQRLDERIQRTREMLRELEALRKRAAAAAPVLMDRQKWQDQLDEIDRLTRHVTGELERLTAEQAKQPPAQPAPAELAEVRRFREERLKAARRVLELELRADGVARSVGHAYAASRRVLEAEREVGRAAAAADHLGRMKALSRLLAGNPGASDLERAEAAYFVAEAEVWAREGGRPAAPPAAKPDGERAEKEARVAVKVADLEERLAVTLMGAERDRVKAQAAELEAKAQKERAERLAAQLQELLARRGGRPPVKAPADFRGTVQRVEATGGDLLVSLTPGSDAGIRQGAVLTVSRGSPPQHLGTVTVLSTDPKQAVGRFQPARTGQRETPREGDELRPQ